jgi:subtilisin family serine protease
VNRILQGLARSLAGLAIALAWAALAPPSAAAAAPQAPVQTTAGQTTPGQTPADQAAAEPAQVLVLFHVAPPHFRAGSDYEAGYGDQQGRAARRRLARAIAHERGLTLVTDWPMPVLGLDCYVMQAPPGHSAAELAAQLSADPRIAWAEPMNRYQGRSRGHTDPLFAAQPAARLWRLNDLHEISTGRHVRVAVIDSQVDTQHPDLAGQVAVSEDFVTGHPDAPEQHGTAVAGVIAARADNGQGIVGVAPDARLMALRACWQVDAQASVCDSLSLAKALVFAIEHRAEVINLSLSGPPTLLLGKLVDVATGRGAAVVGAYDPALPAGGFPASHPGVIAVSDSIDSPASVLVAPGRDVPVPIPGGRWALGDGSSYAAAHVSGLLALLRQHGPVSRASLVLGQQSGGGRGIDTCASLLRTFGPCACGCARVSDLAPR